MKKLITIIALCIAGASFADTFYIQNDGTVYITGRNPLPTNTVDNGGITTITIVGDTVSLKTNAYFVDGAPWDGVAVTQTNLYVGGPAVANEETATNYVAYAQMSNGGSNEVTSSAEWSLDPAISNATIALGVLTLTDRDDTQSVDVVASYGGFSATNTVSISGTPEPVPPAQTNTLITGGGALSESNSLQLYAWSMIDDGSSNDVSSSASWGWVSAPASNTTLVDGLITLGDWDSTNTFHATAASGGFTATNSVVFTGTSESPPLAQVLYPEPVYAEATNDYTGFAVYSPPFTNAGPDAGTWTPAEWTRQGDYMYLAGESSATEFVIYDGTTNYSVSTVQSDTYGVGFEVPAGVDRGDAWAVVATNANGYGRTVMAQVADVRWVSPFEVVAGDTFMVLGQNLMLDGNACKLFIDGYGIITSTGGNQYCAEFTCPALSPGSYEVQAHNNHGRQYGWSYPNTLVVRSAPAFDDDTNTWTTLSYADGDCSDELLSAMSTAGSYGTVYLPDGTYLLDDQARTFSTAAVRFVGESRAGAIIMNTTTYTNTAGTSSPMVEFRNGSDIVFSNLTLKCNTSGYMTGSGKPYMFTFIDIDNIALLNVTVDARNETDTDIEMVEFDNCDDIRVEDSTLYLSRGVSIKNGSDGIRVVNNAFHGLNDCGGFFGGLSRMDRVYVTGNTIQNYSWDAGNSDGRCLGRFFTYARSGGYAYFYGNTGINLQPTPGAWNLNAGEWILFEHGTGLNGGTQWRGNPTAVTSTNITLPSGTTKSYYGLIVMDNEGVGQYRTITGWNGDTATIDRPWNVNPTTNSVISLGYHFHDIAVISNNYTGRFPTNNVSNVGFQITGSAHNIIVEGNTFNSARRGISWTSEGLTSPTNYASPIMFAQSLNNTISNCWAGYHIDYDNRASTDPHTNDVALLAVIADNDTVIDNESRWIEILVNDGAFVTGSTHFSQFAFLDSTATLTNIAFTSHPDVGTGDITVKTFINTP